MSSDLSSRIGRARFRAWHRGTREADYLIGGFFNRFHEQWDEAELTWFEDLLEQDDVDILAWALRAQDPPARFEGPQMELLQRLDYVEAP